MLKSGISSKLQSKWRGPFKVTEVIREGGAYRLKDPLSGKIKCRSADKRKPAVRCDKFFVGVFIVILKLVTRVHKFKLGPEQLRTMQVVTIAMRVIQTREETDPKETEKHQNG